MQYWATVSKTVRPMLSDRCPVSLSVSPVLAVTFVHCGQTVGRIKMKRHAGRRRPWPHCVRCGASSPPTKGPRCMPEGVELVCFDLPEFSVVYRVCRISTTYTSCSHGHIVMSSTGSMFQLVNCLETMLEDGVNIILGDFNCLNVNLLSGHLPHYFV